MHAIGVRDISSLNPDASLADLGLDSLMGVEVRQTLERDYDIVMSMRDIRQLTINKLREMSNKSGGFECKCSHTTSFLSFIRKRGIEGKHNIFISRFPFIFSS